MLRLSLFRQVRIPNPKAVLVKNLPKAHQELYKFHKVRVFKNLNSVAERSTKASEYTAGIKFRLAGAFILVSTYQTYFLIKFLGIQSDSEKARKLSSLTENPTLETFKNTNLADFILYNQRQIQASVEKYHEIQTNFENEALATDWFVSAFNSANRWLMKFFYPKFNETLDTSEQQFSDFVENYITLIKNCSLNKIFKGQVWSWVCEL